MKTINRLFILGFLICLGIIVSQTLNPISAKAAVQCSGNDCWYTVCRQNSDCGVNQFTGAQTCQGNSIYQDYMTFTCNSPGTSYANCTRSMNNTYQKTCSTDQVCRNGMCASAGTQGQPATCSPNSYLKCSGNSVYWFDSCNSQQTLYQTCASGQTCSNNACVTTYTPPTPPTPPYVSHMIKGCVNNVSYWYDSSGNQQDIYKNCGASGQTCQNGECVTPIVKYVTKYVPQGSSYSLHYTTKCFNNNIYWYDSKGTIQDLYKSCQDSNQCTVDTCGEGQCANTLKCDGSTCQVGSQDYLKYCGAAPAAAAVSENPLASFLKKWYLWIIIAIIMIFLFIIVFRRLSSNV